MYGQGDYSSIASDAIKACNVFGAIPNLGDHGGAFQVLFEQSYHQAP